MTRAEGNSKLVVVASSCCAASVLLSSTATQQFVSWQLVAAYLLLVPAAFCCGVAFAKDKTKWPEATRKGVVMAKFRKKPVVIDAVQFWHDGDHDDVHRDGRSPTGFSMHTLENRGYKHEVTPGDWIITGVQGETYPCKPDIFTATYEAVET